MTTDNRPALDDEPDWFVQQRLQVAAENWERAVPPRFRHARVEDLDHGNDAHVDLLGWSGEIFHRRSVNLVIGGPVGVGKTHAAFAALQPVMTCAEPPTFKFVPSVEMYDQLRPGGDADAFDAYAYTGVLFIDDLGMERPTDWTAERLYGIINRRWLSKKPTVATTNLAPAELRSALGERVCSRLVDGATVVWLDGPDRRLS